MDTVLVTGGAGYVGTHLVPKLLGEYEVRVLDNYMYGQDTLLRYIPHPSFELIKGDVRDPETVEFATHGVDYVIHLAAIVGALCCSEQESKARAVNHDGTRTLVDAAPDDCGFVYASTGSVYGRVDGVCDEATEVGPLSVYATSKLRGENYVREYTDHVVYRPATAFGLSARPRMELLPNFFVKRGVMDGGFELYESDYERTFVHVDDLARSFAHAVRNFDRMSGEAYNVGHERMNLTKGELCDIVQEFVDMEVEYVDGEFDPEKRDYSVSYEKIRSTGFEPRISLRESVQNMVEALETVPFDADAGNY